ncbi:MAG: phosphoribosyltransferase [Thaumarchaeota archaeon]|nr:phosphoribosyltransferase [Nitrososphaerota archaeon]
MKFWDFLAKGKIELAYGALWSYSPWGTSPTERRSRDYRYYLKNEQTVKYGDKEMFMSEVVGQAILESKATLPFMGLFGDNPVLVPVTRSSLFQPNSLWVGLKVATAMRKVGLGTSVSTSLVRTRAVGTKASAEEHYDSQRVEQKLLTDPENILLVDDIVTRGATMIASL